MTCVPLRPAVFVLLASLAGTASSPGQTTPAPAKLAAPTASAPTTLTIAGDVATPLSLTAADLKGLPRTKVEVKDEGRIAVYEGVLVGETPEEGRRAGWQRPARQRRGHLRPASATDGYQVVFSLPELDNSFTSNDIIVADTIDGKPLFAYQGPWRIVAPKDARGARSIRRLERLEVVRLRK